MMVLMFVCVSVLICYMISGLLLVLSSGFGWVLVSGCICLLCLVVKIIVVVRVVFMFDWVWGWLECIVDVGWCVVFEFVE